MSLQLVETPPPKQNRSSEELEMRELVVPKLRARWPEARIVHELPLRYSTNRIDLAAICPTEIISVEIKSSRDVADRLEAQLRAFVPISSRVIVALAPKWNEKLPAIMKPRRGGTAYTPQYTPVQATIHAVGEGAIETWTVDATAKSIEVTSGGYSPNRKPWLSQMLHMLHVAELEQIAMRHRISCGKKPTHKYLYEECSDLMNGREIVTAVCAALRARRAFAAGSDAPIETN
jgi:hypothetical protein